MEYLDFDVELIHEAGRDYRVTVRSPAGEASAPMRFPYDEVALELALVKLQNALLRSGGPARRALTDEEQAVHAFGHTLFEALMTGEVRSRYAVSRAKADQEEKGLRVRLHIEAPDLAALPWEYLYDQGEGEYLCLSRSTPLVRYLNLPRSRETLTVAPPLRILGLVASPDSPATPRLDVETEQARLERALNGLTKRGLVELHWLEGHTWRDLQQAMWPGHGPWHMLHFIGHGGFNEQSEEGMLALETDEGGLHLLSATHLGRVLRDHRSLRLVLLNSCEGAKGSKHDRFSSVGATLARAGIPAVLAMQYEITDRAALELTRTFYEALAGGLPVDAALTEARLAINIGISNSLEWGTPVLFQRASEGTLFHLEGAPPPPVVTMPDPSPAPPPAEAPPVNAAPPQPTPPTSQEQPAPQPKASPQKTKEQWLEEAVTLFDQERYEEALAALERALALAPNLALAWYDKGKTLNRLKRYEEALAAFERALQLDPNHANAWNGKSNMLYNLKRYQEALAALERALQLDPNNADAWNGKGNMLFDLKRYQEALAAFERALQLDPGNAFAGNSKGNALLGLKRYQEAVAAYERNLNLYPNHVPSWNGKGTAFLELKRYEKALVAFERALQLDPNHADVWKDKGAALFYLKRYQEALAAFEQAIRLDPDDGSLHNNKGYTLKALGRTAEAEQAFKKARELGYTG